MAALWHASVASGLGPRRQLETSRYVGVGPQAAPARHLVSRTRVTVVRNRQEPRVEMLLDRASSAAHRVVPYPHIRLRRIRPRKARPAWQRGPGCPDARGEIGPLRTLGSTQRPARNSLQNVEARQGIPA